MTRHRFPPTPMPKPECIRADNRILAWIGALAVGSIMAFTFAWWLT